MLNRPMFKTNNIINILGIDPGISNMGLNVTKYDTVFNTYKSIVTKNISLNDMVIPNMGIIIDSHTDRFAKLMAFKPFLSKYIEDNDIDVISCEAAFFNPTRPAAYAALIEVIQTIREVTLTVDKYTQMYTYPPMYIKKNIMHSIGVKTGVKKEDMLAAILTIDELTKHISDIDRLTEHEIDSLAVTHTYILRNHRL